MKWKESVKFLFSPVAQKAARSDISNSNVVHVRDIRKEIITSDVIEKFNKLRQSSEKITLFMLS